MLVAGIDLETTGLDFTKDWITEVGVVIFDGTTWEEKASYSTFIYIPEALPLSPEIVKLTGITDEMVKTGVSIEHAITEIVAFTKGCEAFVAHNKEFDAQMLAANIKRKSITVPPDFITRPWICSKNDVETHQGARCTKLSHLALDYGVTVNGAKLHRALDDVKLMGELLARTKKTAQEIKAYCDEPWVYLEAQCAGPWTDGGKSTGEARAMGFGWEKSPGTYGPVFPKKWVKRLKQSKLAAEKEKTPQTFKRVTLPTPTETK